MEQHNKFLIWAVKAGLCYWAASIIAFIAFAESSHSLSVGALVFVSPMVAPVVPILAIRDYVAGGPVSKDLAGMFAVFSVVFPVVLIIAFRAAIAAVLQRRRGGD